MRAEQPPQFAVRALVEEVEVHLPDRWHVPVGIAAIECASIVGEEAQRVAERRRRAGQDDREKTAAFVSHRRRDTLADDEAIRCLRLKDADDRAARSA